MRRRRTEMARITNREEWVRGLEECLSDSDCVVTGMWVEDEVTCERHYSDEPPYSEHTFRITFMKGYW